MTKPLLLSIRFLAIASLFLATTLGCNSSTEPATGDDTKPSDTATEEPAKETEESAAAEPSLDRTDAAAVAKAALTAYKNKDMAAFAEVVTSFNKKIFTELAAQGEAHPRYNSIFQGARWEAVQAWDGSTIEARQDGPQNAAVRFLNDEQDEMKVVILERDAQGQWAFDDINFWEVDRFNALEKIE